jgi:hypothetical protein
VEEIIDEPAELMERAAALGIGKAALTACMRVPHQTKPRAHLQKGPQLHDDHQVTARTAGLAPAITFLRSSRSWPPSQREPVGRNSPVGDPR